MNLAFSFKQKLILSIGVLLIVLVAGLMLFNFNRVQNIILNNELEQSQMIVNQFYESMNEQLETSRSVIVPIAKNEQVVEYFANRDRQALIQLLKPIFAELQPRGFYNIQFNIPPSTAFLRLNNLNNFDDDISHIRPSVVEANKRQAEVMGLEGGNAGYGFRVLVPIFKDNFFLGTVETGLHFNHQFLEEFQKVAPGNYYIYESVAMGQEDQLLNLSGDEDFFEIDPELIGKAKQTGEAQYGLTKDNLNSVIIIPFRDFSGDLKGYVNAIFSRNHIVTELNNNKRETTLIAIVGILLVLSVAYVIVNSTIRPVVQLSDAAETIAKGDLTREIRIDYRSKDEIGNLIIAFNQMKSNLVGTITLIAEGVVRLNTHSQELAASNQELTATAEEVASLATQVASASDQSAGNAVVAAEESEKVRSAAARGM